MAQVGDLKKSFLSGSAISLSGGILLGLFGYLNRRLCATVLTETEYAFFYTIFSYITVTNMVFMLGVANGSFFLIPDCCNQGASDKARGVFSWGLRYITMAMIGVTLLGWGVIFLGTDFFEKYQVSGITPWLVLLIPLPLALQVYCSKIMLAMKGFFWSNLFQVANVVIILISLCLFLESYRVNTVIIAYAIAGYVSAAGLLWVITSKFHYPLFKSIPSNTRRRLHTMGIWLMITGFGYECISDLGTLSLSIVSTPQQVALYNIAFPIAMIVRSIAVVSGVFAPFSNELFRQNKIAAIERILNLSLLFTVGSIIILIPVFYFGGELIIMFLFGSKFIHATTATMVLTQGVMLWNGANFYSDILASIQHEKNSSFITIFVTLLSIILYFILGKYYGALGAAFTVVIICALWFAANFICLKTLLRRYKK